MTANLCITMKSGTHRPANCSTSHRANFSVPPEPMLWQLKKGKERRETGLMSQRGEPLSLSGLGRPQASALCASTSIFHTPQPVQLSAHPTAYTALGIVCFGVMVCVWLTARYKGSKQSVKLYIMINMCLLHESQDSVFIPTPSTKST